MSLDVSILRVKYPAKPNPVTLKFDVEITCEKRPKTHNHLLYFSNENLKNQLISIVTHVDISTELPHLLRTILNKEDAQVKKA
jgi:hypothetical protein